MRNMILIIALGLLASCQTEDVQPVNDYTGNYTGDMPSHCGGLTYTYSIENDEGNNYTFAESIKIEILDGEFEVENGGVTHKGTFIGDTLFYCQSSMGISCCGEFIK